MLAQYVLLAGAVLLAPRVAVAQRAAASPPVVVASKPFGESYLLAEMFAQLLESADVAVTRRPGLGATEIAFSALRTDAIDVYPEYTGTGLVAVLRDTVTEAMRRDPRLAYDRVSREFPLRFGVRWLPPLGFQNGYAIAVRRETAERLHLVTLSDVARHGRELTAGFTNDFVGRADGFAGLAKAYGLAFAAVRPLAPAVKYEALASRSVDIIDGYSTDGLLAKYDLVTLQDDRHFFPPYEAAALISPRLARERPEAIAILSRLSGRLTEPMVREWNRRVEVAREPVTTVARDALASLGLVVTDANTKSARRAEPGAGAGFAAFFWARRAETLRLTGEHAVLVLVALAAAILVAVPLGLVLARIPGVAEAVMQLLGVLQTIPSIAMLAFMIPILGIGVRPALVALWLYALLPIVRATYTGVHHADPDAVTAAEALGTTAWQRLWWVQVPLAAPVVLAGVRTAAVITVGAATLAAFIGAGGLGEPIVTGLGLADTRLVLAGAIPAAVLAVLVDLALAGVERAVGPAHQRTRR